VNIIIEHLLLGRLTGVGRP